MMKIPQMPQPKGEYILFAGGLDTETPRWNIRPGALRDSQNYEIGLNGGYTEIVGYERFDGQTSPSDAQYGILQVTISGEFSVGDEVIQQNTAAAGTVVAVVTTETPNYLVLTKTSGTFNDSDDLEVSASVEGTSLSALSLSGASTNQLDAQYINLAADEYRGDIAEPTGAGRILGVVFYNDVVYCFRNNAGATAANLWKSSASGWDQVDLGYELEFTSGGTYEIAEGDTITGATSTETATVTRVVLESGSWSGGDAAGRLIFSTASGAFQAENLDVGANSNVATISGDATAIALQPNGRYVFDIKNFGGQIGTKRVYGCDGVNQGFEFDGTVYTPINTGMDEDRPVHVVVHKKHLFFAFGSSAQHSGPGTPYIFSPVFGAAELATGDDITGFMVEPGDSGGATLGIYNRNTTHMLYGSSSADWQLVEYREEVGAYAHTIQQAGTTFFLYDQGITNLQTTQRFGNFSHATVSNIIKSYINTRRFNAIASTINRNKSQYRLFFSDGSAIYMTLNQNGIAGFMPIVFPNPVTCIHSAEDSTGRERTFFGSTNGMVYELDKGTSFDGEEKEAYMIFHYLFSKSIRTNKKYVDITFEVEGEGYSEFDFSYELGYGSTRIPQPSSVTESLDLSLSVNWDDSVLWDTAVFWDGQSLLPSVFKLNGTAENIGLIIRKNSDYFKPTQFNGALLRHLPRRQLRS